MDALEKMIRGLKWYRKNSEKGLAALQEMYLQGRDTAMFNFGQ